MKNLIFVLGILLISIIQYGFCVMPYCLNGRLMCRATDNVPTSDPTGICVQLSDICNGINDCGAGVPATDEESCGSTIEIDECSNKGYKMCRDPTTPTCLHPSLFCDGKKDCPDGGDEKHCPSCNDNQFRCGSGECLYRMHMCNFIQDCGDAGDEDPSFCDFSDCPATDNEDPPDKRIPCIDTDTANSQPCSTQFLRYLCREVGSSPCTDEDNLYGCPVCAHENYYMCYDGSKCVHRRQVCDGVDDCPDASDEDAQARCARTDCPSGQQACYGGNAASRDQCVNTADLCNPDHSISPGYPVPGGGTCNETPFLPDDTFERPYFCGPAFNSSDQNAPPTCPNLNCEKCVVLTTTIWRCICEDGKTHPVNASGVINIELCDTACTPATHCGSNALDCIGTATSFICVCPYGYYTSCPGNMMKCEKRNCEVNADCIGADGLDIHQCIHDFQTIVEIPSGTPVENLDFYDKFCLCAPGYTNAFGTSTCVKEGCTNDEDCGAYYNGTIDVASEGLTPLGGTCSAPNCVCEEEYILYLGGCHAPCENSVCGVRELTSLNSDGVLKRPQPTGECDGIPTNYTCSCYVLPIGSDLVQMQHPVDADGNVDETRCDLPCSVDDCGRGAINCTGTARQYKCTCDEDNFIANATDPTKCFVECNADINTETIYKGLLRDICGVGVDTCLVGQKEWSETFCVCKADYVLQDGKCLSECLTDLISCCGSGAISCNGSLVSPKCQCSFGYEEHPTTGKCREKHCEEREVDPCFNGKCEGSFWGWTCLCDDGFHFDPVERVCKGCDVKKCGSGYVNGNFTYYAYSCTGVNASVDMCNCKDGFIHGSSAMDTCVRASCEDLQCNMRLDTPLLDSNEFPLTPFGSCYGDYYNYTCICNYNFELVDFPMSDGSFQKVCAPVDCSKSERSLCGNHGYCVGYLQNYQCVCNYGYRAVNRLCVPDDCLTENLCGPVGVTGCRFGEADEHGSYLDSRLICECNVFGYTTSSNGSLCIEALCDESTAVDACGEGATGCTGTILQPTCECDKEKHYYPSSNFRQCESSCLHNEEVVTTCGPGNTCHGPFDDYTCVCQAFGFTPNIDSKKLCDRMDCSMATESLSALDVAIRVCGEGALGCFGSWVEPRCACDIDSGYVTSTTLRSCVKDLCVHNEKVYRKCRIADGNSCFGSLLDATCDCRAKGFQQNVDATECEEIACNADIDGLTSEDIAVMACGKGALGCSGTLVNPLCICDVTNFYYPGTLAKSCVIGDCRANGKIQDSCKMVGTANTCQGPENGFVCLCKGKGYENDPSDPTVCKEIECSKAMSVCGEGVYQCSGTVLNPVCECNMDTHVPAVDGQSCVSKAEAGCTLDESIRSRCKINDGNICHGSTTHFVCICTANGFVENGENECVEIECNAMNAVDVCGVGAIDCSGTMRNPKCECDATKNYLATVNLLTCDKANCGTNSLILQRCGPGNSCVGTVENYKCLCQASGFVSNPEDKTSCLEVPCGSSIDDAISVCGTGALKCMGLIRSPTCVCDFENGYVASALGTSCIPAECFHNPAAAKQCGKGNSCTGSFKSFACVCTAAGYETDLKNPSICNKVYCSSSTDFVQVCGEGAIGCEGPLSSPTCICDNEQYFVTSADGTRCEIADCRKHPDSIKCGPDRPCKGTVASFQCKCNAKGYEYVPGDLKQCKETPCTSENVVQVCGEGAIDCRGTMNHPQCLCDVSNNYIALASTGKCVAADCKNNRVAMANCGPGNSCQGTYRSSQCVCNAKGFTNDPTDPTVCKEVMCSEVTDFTLVCGSGAIGCEGSTREPKCYCDLEQSYVASEDGKSCVLANCEANKMAQERCGKGNKCQGTYKYFSCLCVADGYEPDPMDVTKCIQRQCTNEIATKICGDGATSCSGPVTAPMCECNTIGYMPGDDKHSCQPQPCRFNKAVNCLDGNTCSGTYFSPTCVCEAPHYLTDPDNPLTCLYAPCKVEDCGGDGRQGASGLFAESCQGTSIAPECECKMGFSGTGTALCVLLPCNQNPNADCQDHGKCNGTFMSWSCVCDAPSYVQHPRDKTQCIEAPCNVASCGRSVRDGVTYNHAETCQGSEKDRKCQCYGGYLGHDTPYCKPLTCSENPEASCSDNGKCKGSFYKWSCVCDGPDYIQDPTNPTKCIPAPCIKERCGKKLIRNSNTAIYFAYGCEGTTIEPKCLCKDEYTGTGGPYCNRALCSSENAIEHCGKGATDCEGFSDEPVCKCDESRKYVTNHDASRCILSTCENHPDFKHCGPGNACKGTIDSFQCVCSADGWENVPENVKQCREMSCTKDLAITACGTGALDCAGTFLHPKCLCDTSKDFITDSITRKCVEASCKNSKDFALRCGIENSCTGSIDSYICVCNTKGYRYDSENPNNCKEVMCDDIRNYESVCGEGAIGCMGSTKQPICQCNNNKDFITSPDGQSCIPATCKHNIEAVTSCGSGNKCIGTFKDYSCVCDAFGYEPDDDNLKTCKFKECNNNIAEKICGDGATGCTGTILNPICECYTEGFVLSGDKHTCKPMDCRFDEQLKCGPGNKCSGTYFSASCVCKGPMYMTDQTNPKHCLPAPCKIEECGKDEDRGRILGLFAEDCSGTYIEPICDCKPGYDGSGTPYCTPKDCKENPLAICGEGGQCKGTFFKWKCVCQAPKYIKDVFDPEKCIIAPCKLDSCGYHTKLGTKYYYATQCEGYLDERVCQCKEGFDGNGTPYCKPKDCTENPLANCNNIGRCKGSYIDWICVCNQPEYMQDAVDPTVCTDAPCKVENCGRGLVKGFHVNFAEKCQGTYTNPNCFCKKAFVGKGTGTCQIKYADSMTNAEEHCGKGATAVEGPLTEPLCHCDESRNYVSTPDGSACVLGDCNRNEESKNCGPGNKCVGSAKSFQCVCEAEGWQADPYDLQSCIEIACDSEVVTKVCGYGSLSCTGTINQPICECDIKKGYVINEHGKCELADCSSSMDIMRSCGRGNKCIGNIKSYICKCTSKGFEAIEDDPTSCREVMCDEVYDVAEVCGEGAKYCTGYVKSPLCFCDEENNFITSDDGLSCIPATCEHNIEMQKRCGKGNKCGGTYKGFTCICTAYGYEPHPTDMTQCVQKSCEEELAEEVCGDGATGCMGTLLNPICQCDKKGYMMSGDKHSCQPMDCRFNEDLQCGKGNSCKGTYFSAVCVCEAPSYLPDKENPQTCKEANCDYKLCGMVMHGNVPHYYASGCTGSYKERSCLCKDGYDGTGTPYCKPESCNENDIMSCGGATGRCKGTVDNWSCVCDAPVYMLDPTNNRMCIEAPCQVEQCGFGYIDNMKTNFAVSCEGTYKNATCNCRKHGFVLEDGLCIIDRNCSNSLKGQLCNSRGKCYGDYFHFRCKCKAPEYQAKDDIQSCEEAPCHLTQCGSTEDENGNLFYHASKCYGTYKKFSCNCKDGYFASPTTGQCVPAHCNTVPNVCNGNGHCNGTAMNYTCQCYDHYDNPDGDMKACKEADCTSHENVCDGHGNCQGTFSVFDCICFPGHEQKRYENGIPTCVKASCKDSQCGGTNMYPFGSCGNGLFDNYTCTCNSGYAHPMLPSGRKSLTECGVPCDPLQCGKSGVKRCEGTRDSFSCVCENDFLHPNDSLGNPDKKICKPKCRNDQCGGDHRNPHGNCTGTKVHFSCKCNDGYDHPLDNILEPIRTICREQCHDEHCGVTDLKDGDLGPDDRPEGDRRDPPNGNNGPTGDNNGNSNSTGNTGRPGQILHGKCSGSLIGFTCKCAKGFEHPKNLANYPDYSLCIDINECKRYTNPCHAHAKCINTPGSFICKCKDRYVGMGMRDSGCYVNGGWGKWKYTACSATCGKGVSKKSRECLVPEKYRSKGVCEGEDEMEIKSCNNFPCTGLCKRQKCGCGHVEYLVSRYLRMDEHIHSDDEYIGSRKKSHYKSMMLRRRYKDKHFSENEPISDDVEKLLTYDQATNILSKFTGMASKNLCLDSIDSQDSIKKMLKEEMGLLKETLENYKNMKYELRTVISCNQNPYFRDQLFIKYKKVIKETVMLKFVRSDIDLEHKKILHKLSNCQVENSFGLGDIMEMIGENQSRQRQQIW